MKKFLASVLALMLLAIPFAGIAEDVSPLDTLLTQSACYTTAMEGGRRLTFRIDLSDIARNATGEPALDQVVYDVLDALVVTGYMQGDEVYYAIGMKQANGEVADLLTYGVATAGDDMYLHSNMIGGTIVVGADEVLPLLNRVIDMLVQMGFMTERDARSIKAEMEQAFSIIPMESMNTAGKGLANVDVMQLDFSALLGMVEVISSKVVVGEPAMLPKLCDPAASMVTLTLTPDEMNGLIGAMIRFVMDNPELADAIAVETGFDVSMGPALAAYGEEPVSFNDFLGMALKELETTELYTGNTVVRCWLDENGGVVAMDGVAPMAEGTVSFSYSRMTVNDGAAHSFQMSFPEGDITLNVMLRGRQVMVDFAVAEEGTTLMSMRIDYTDRSQGNVLAGDAAIDMVIVDDSSYNRDASDEFRVHFDCAFETVLNGVDFTQKGNAVVSVNGEEYATVNFEISSGDPVDSIMNGNVVRPAELNDVDFSSWFIGVFNAIYTWATDALFAMPVSLIHLINTGY